jgi:hypothetical protein
MGDIRHKSLKLPSEDSELKKFLSKNKLSLMEQVLNSIEYAIENEIESVEIFSFKDSDFIVSLHRDKFLENIENIYKFYVNEEKYELCSRVKRINLKLLKKV